MSLSDQVDLLLKARALEYTSCGVTLADARVPELPLIFANPGFQAISGYREDEILGQNCRFLQRHDREQAGLAELRSAIDAGNECTVLLRNYRKDGSLFWNELVVSPILDRDQNLTHFVGVQTDVTLRRREQKLREKAMADLQLTNEELDSFAHIVSHDLRAPLRGVEKLCQVLVDCHSCGLDPEGQRLVGLMRSRLNRMSGLLEGVLRYSRSRSEAETWEEVDVGRLVRNVCEMLSLPDRLEIRIAPNLPKVYGDSTRLAQVFQNLIDNAAKFQDSEGSIAVEGRPIEDGWQFSVADEGPGIEPEHQERVFGMFQTIHSRDQLETVGVGLAVVKKAIDRLGGRVWVESEPGRGATFHFTIPKDPPAPTTSDYSKASEPTRRDASPS